MARGGQNIEFPSRIVVPIHLRSGLASYNTKYVNIYSINNTKNWEIWKIKFKKTFYYYLCVI